MYNLLSSSVDQSVHLNLPGWSVLPFVGLLLTIGVMSAITANIPHHPLAHLWESNTNKLIIALFWAFPVLLLFLTMGAWEPLIETMHEYIAFIVLLFSLFAISGGIFIEGDLKARPIINTTFLGIGAVLANLVGTTGASMLLIRPMLRTNSERRYTAHIPIFFIFLVGNIGGCLLPIGDPPLFLGYLQGVPFFWTLNLLVPWLMTVGLVLAIFFVWDSLQYRKEDPKNLQIDAAMARPIRIHGAVNFLLLLGVVLTVIFVTPEMIAAQGLEGGPLVFVREYMMLLFTAMSFVITPLSDETRRNNNFTFGPIVEVAYLFIGIFIAMVPALEILRSQGPELGITQVWQFFWFTGGLSAVLDNAPTYLTFLSVAEGLAAQNPGQYTDLISLTSGQVPAVMLEAISLGAVFCGAITYIGNGPNFMIKAIAEEWGYKVPDFFTYIIKYALPVLIPTYLVVTYIFFALLSG